jgi:hypothetical protein
MPAPQDYARWCLFAGANPYHPGAWTPEQRASYHRWRLDAFREWWRSPSGRDHARLVRAQAGRQTLIDRIRADLGAALQAPPTRPYARCPCHRKRLGGTVRTDPWIAEGRRAAEWLIAQNPARREVKS